MTPARNVTSTGGILGGGMGLAASVVFARLFAAACADHVRVLGNPVSDQALPEHRLAQTPAKRAYR